MRRPCHCVDIRLTTGRVCVGVVDGLHFRIGKHAVKHHALVDGALELRTVSAVATTGADHEVIVVDGQGAGAAVLLCKSTIDEVLLVSAVHTRTDVSPLVQRKYRSTPPAPAARSEGSLQRTRAVLNTELVGAFSAVPSSTEQRVSNDQADAA